MDEFWKKFGVKPKEPDFINHYQDLINNVKLCKSRQEEVALVSEQIKFLKAHVKGSSLELDDIPSKVLSTPFSILFNSFQFFSILFNSFNSLLIS